MAASYEEGFSPWERRFHRLLRGLRWHVKGLLGRERHLLVELRWRLGDEIMALPVLTSYRALHPKVVLHVLTHYPDIFIDSPDVQVVDTTPTFVDGYVLLRGAPRQVYRLAVYAEKLQVPVPTLRPALSYERWTLPDHLSLPEGTGPLVIVAPGASWSSKRWLPERWTALIQALEDQGCRVIVLGAADEGVGAGLDWCGQTSVKEAACVLHHAALLICCDSGLLHLGLAAGTPAIALFGPTDPEILIRNEARFTALCSLESCHGFWNHATEVGVPGECPDGHACCLASIEVEDVLEAVQHRLGEAWP